MQVHFNLSHEETWTIAQHAVASIVPLRSRDTPCGIVTIVGGMHLGKAHVATQAVGITDYITHEKSGLVVPPRDPAALASAIKRLRDEPKFTEEMGRAAALFAAEQCSEAATVAHFRERLNVWFG